MKKLILSLSVLLLWMGVHYTCAGQLHNSVIVIIRHAEKPADGDGLAAAGEARAIMGRFRNCSHLWVRILRNCFLPKENGRKTCSAGSFAGVRPKWKSQRQSAG
jgi:hypothetical protein